MERRRLAGMSRESRQDAGAPVEWNVTADTKVKRMERRRLAGMNRESRQDAGAP